MNAPRLKVITSDAAGKERRSIPRVDVRSSDGITCSISATGEILYIGRPYDLSLSSIAVIVPEENVERLLGPSLLEFELEIPDKGKFQFEAKLVLTQVRKNQTAKMVFSFGGSGKNANTAQNDPDVGEFVFPPNFSINAFFYKPNFFYERCFVRLQRIAKGKICFHLYDQETILFPQMKMDVYLFDASAQMAPLSVKVESIQGRGAFSEISCEILDFPKALARRVSDSLSQEFQLSLDAIRKLDLPVPRISDGLRFRYVRTQEEYIEVLKLRFKAYQLAGKVAEGKTYLDMTASLDHMSRILIAYHGDRIVSSVAISFPDSDDLTLDTEHAFVGGYPKPVPPKTQCIEVARLCTDPEYRGSDLLLRVFEHTYKTLQCGGRTYIITSTDNKLWPLYKKLGFAKTGMSYPHPYLAGLEHHVIVVHVHRAERATGIDPLRWNYLYRDMNDYLGHRRVYKIRFAQRMKLSIYKFIGRLMKIRTKN